MILDSSFLIDLMADDSAAVAKMSELDRQQLTVPTLVYTEVGSGLESGSTQERRFESVIDEVKLAPYDTDAARRAVEIQRQLSRQGNPVGAVDAMIAGTALVRDEPVVTRNVTEFRRTPARVDPY